MVHQSTRCGGLLGSALFLDEQQERSKNIIAIDFL